MGNGVSEWSIPRTRGIVNAIGSFIVSKGRKETGETVRGGGGRGWVKVGERRSWWRNVFARGSRYSSRDVETKGVSRETFDMEYLIAMYLSDWTRNRMITSVFTILFRNWKYMVL